MQWLVHPSSRILIKGDAEKELLYFLGIHKSQNSKLCIAFTLDENFLSKQGDGYKTEFSRKAHCSDCAGIVSHREISFGSALFFQRENRDFSSFFLPSLSFLAAA